VDILDAAKDSHSDCEWTPVYCCGKAEKAQKAHPSVIKVILLAPGVNKGLLMQSNAFLKNIHNYNFINCNH